MNIHLKFEIVLKTLRRRTRKKMFTFFIKDYKNTFKIGYLSIILFSISLILALFFKKFYGSINGNWAGPITIITAIIALVVYIYFIINTSKLQDNPGIYKKAIILAIVGAILAYVSAQSMG
jgi:hypothetical protein